MSVAIHSPPSSEALPPLDSLSPPPTPAAKRARQFCSSSNVGPMPMFFPKSLSILGTEPCPFRLKAEVDEAVEKKRLAHLGSRPVPRLQLRSTLSSRGTEQNIAVWAKDGSIARQINMNQIPQLPYDNFSFKSIESELPEMPAMGSSSKSSGSSSPIVLTPKTPAVSAIEPTHVKLPSFQRNKQGLRQKRRSSFAARTA